MNISNKIITGNIGDENSFIQAEDLDIFKWTGGNIISPIKKVFYSHCSVSK